MEKNKPKSRTSDEAKREKTNLSCKTKKQACIDFLKRPKGASLTDLQKATGWLPHSVRRFLSGTMKRLPGVVLVTDVDGGGTRRYRVEAGKGS